MGFPPLPLGTAPLCLWQAPRYRTAKHDGGHVHFERIQLHFHAGQPVPVLAIEHKDSLGADKSTSAIGALIPFVVIKVGSVLDKVHPVRVHEEEARHIEHLLEYQCDEHHGEPSG